MNTINELARRQAACEQEIREQKQKIWEYERAYESLRRFGGEADTAQGSFRNANSAKLSRTSDLSAIMATCRTARLYLEGSRRTLDGFGAKIVGAAFTGLAMMIRIKLGEYRGKIQDCEDRISMLERKIDSLSGMIEIAREEQERAERETEQ